MGRSRIYTRDEDIYVGVTPRGNVWKPWQMEVQRLFLPGNMVTEVGEKEVRIAMDAKTAKGCTWRPSWIPFDVIDSGRFPGGAGG